MASKVLLGVLSSTFFAVRVNNVPFADLPLDSPTLLTRNLLPKITRSSKLEFE